MYLHTYLLLCNTGVPKKVKVNVVNIDGDGDGDVDSFLLIWEIPDNNYDPIIMYHVSCSGDAPCPQSYNTSDNHTTSYTFTDFNPNGYYKFSVVAFNSYGSGEAGVKMVGEIHTTTIAPSVVSMTTTTIITTTNTTIAPSENMSMTSSSESMSVDMSSEIMMNSTSTVDVISTTMSSVSITPTMTSTEDMTTSATTTSDITSTVGMTHTS